jgi:hypothetical protein
MSLRRCKNHNKPFPCKQCRIENALKPAQKPAVIDRESQPTIKVPVDNQSLLIVATGSQPANLSLDNGGTITGLATYFLTPGDFLAVSFDGTNLNLISHTGFQS